MNHLATVTMLVMVGVSAQTAINAAVDQSGEALHEQVQEGPLPFRDLPLDTPLRILPGSKVDHWSGLHDVKGTATITAADARRLALRIEGQVRAFFKTWKGTRIMRFDVDDADGMIKFLGKKPEDTNDDGSAPAEIRSTLEVIETWDNHLKLRRNRTEDITIDWDPTRRILTMVYGKNRLILGPQGP